MIPTCVYYLNSQSAALCVKVGQIVAASGKFAPAIVDIQLDKVWKAIQNQLNLQLGKFINCILYYFPAF